MMKRLPRVGGNVKSYIPLERQCIREGPSAGGNVVKPMRYAILKFTAYARVLSDTFIFNGICFNKGNYPERTPVYHSYPDLLDFR